MKWFKHDSDANRDAKLHKLRIKYGMTGYGLYWYCLELIAGDVGEGNLTFEMEHDSEIIAHDTGINYELIQEMMGYMVGLGLFENNDGVIRCEKLARRLDKSMTSNRSIKKLITEMRIESSDYSGYVYFLVAESEVDTKVKIGRSKNPWQRLKEITKTEDAQGYELEIVATVNSEDCVNLETQLHRYFKENNIKNEWFKFTNDIESLIKLIQKNKIKTDVDLLSHVVVSPEEKRREEKRREEGKAEKPSRSKKFIPPTVGEVKDYCLERKNNINANKFVSHYETNDWHRGKTKIKNWKAAVRYWESMDDGRSSKQNDPFAGAT